MEAERLFLLVFIGLALIIVTAVIITINWRAANGGLQRNQWTGFRTPSTMRSDQAWVAGHRAALRLAPLHLLTLAATLTALVFATLRMRTTNGVQLVVLSDMIVIVLVGGIYTAVVAGRAAKSADDHPVDRHPLTPNPRYPTVIHFYAALNVLLLIATCAGLWFLAARSSSNSIPPNTTLGFRDQHTVASMQGWYAGQRVGFHFAAIAATIVTATVLAFLAVAYANHLKPMWILIIPVIGEIALVVCFVIAGRHADQAASSAGPEKQASNLSRSRANVVSVGRSGSLEMSDYIELLPRA